MGQSENKRKVRLGSVVSNKGDKTIIVRVERKAKHPVYGKMIRVARKYYAHDPNNEANIGDIVKIIECRPISKTKRWLLQEIVQRPTLEVSI